MINLATKIKSPFKKLYRHLFYYDLDKISIYSQIDGKILAYLSLALLHHAFVLITYPNGESEIGKITKRISSSKFLLKSSDNKILKIISLKDIYRIDMA